VTTTNQSNEFHVSVAKLKYTHDKQFRYFSTVYFKKNVGISTGALAILTYATA